MYLGCSLGQAPDESLPWWQQLINFGEHVVENVTAPSAGASVPYYGPYGAPSPTTAPIYQQQPFYTGGPTSSPYQAGLFSGPALAMLAIAGLFILSRSRRRR